MSTLRQNYVAHHAAGTIAKAVPGGKKKKTAPKKKAKKSKGAGRGAAAGDVNGPHGGIRGGARSKKKGKSGKLYRRRVSHNNTTKKSSYGSTVAKTAKNLGKAVANQAGQAFETAGSALKHMTRKWSGMGNLNRAAHLFRGSQAGKPQGPQTAAGKRGSMLNNLGSCIGLDHALGKVNPNDKAFAYRLPEARTLCATINMMGANNHQGKKKDTKKSEGKKPMSKAAFARGKQTIRRIAAMFSDAVVPDDLPADYQRQAGYA